VYSNELRNFINGNKIKIQFYIIFRKVPCVKRVHCYAT